MAVQLNPRFNEVGLEFSRTYHQFMETNRKELARFYCADSMLTFENNMYKGQVQIMEKLESTPLSKFNIISCDCQPSLNNGVICVIIGDLQIEQNPPMRFSRTFHLLPSGSSYILLNDVFRLCIG
ncbi:Nuclear transport factor 2 [Babesia microti strain RI]|uniref:Nuclear transport factor 2 n=1 Tax=Babesia microti (strain RI) TaxID=1133968 RepID=I7I843_BABMR|nr:Nuclear transport factor 2 [Babesia microti strain RI]CCF72863.1 Nuclear transport factor 2 [Babesia microti strain RI]|eukprot:XP_012647472.1 Nuclear transport factor 2 [Babesia microti strain RI]